MLVPNLLWGPHPCVLLLISFVHLCCGSWHGSPRKPTSLHHKTTKPNKPPQKTSAKPPKDQKKANHSLIPSTFPHLFQKKGTDHRIEAHPRGLQAFFSDGCEERQRRGPTGQLLQGTEETVEADLQREQRGKERKGGGVDGVGGQVLCLVYFLCFFSFGGGCLFVGKDLVVFFLYSNVLLPFLFSVCFECAYGQLQFHTFWRRSTCRQ